MQIRLTVVDPLGPPSEPRGRAAACDVLVTAPAGTALAAVASALASAVGGSDSQVVLYAGAERLDAQRSTVGEPPLTDGAVLSLGSPAEPGPDVDDVAAQLQVVAGPDAGGVHLLHGGQIRVGRSADADVPLDDPDVSRLHCAVTVTPEGRVSVADLGSTNGTTLNGSRVGTRPVRFAPGALLRVGESALRLAPPGGTGSVATTPDGEGHVRVTVQGEARGADAGRTGSAPTASVPHARVGGTSRDQASPGGETHHSYGSAEWGAAGGIPTGHEPGPVVPEQGGAPRIENSGSSSTAAAPHGEGADTDDSAAADAAGPDAPGVGGRKGTPPRGTDVPSGARKRAGLGAWARRLAGGRGEPADAGQDTYDEEEEASAEQDPSPVTSSPESWPDPATLLLTALGPGPRLWERGPGHPETLTVRLGTTDRAAPDGSGLLPAVPVTADLREAGALGLAGPRERLMGLARAVVAQLAALHSPDALEIVLISADRSRPVENRTAEWSWLGWLPHLRPTHGQDCRLLLAYDREQATARTDELLRRLDDHPPTPSAPHDGEARGGARRPSWAREEDPSDGAFDGPYTVLVVDGDPGGADVRESVARLAHEGSRAGIHVICLAETASASPASPVTDTYEAACETSPPFRECGAVALLSGDVATALRLLRVAPGGSPETTAPSRGEAPHAGSTDSGSTRLGSTHGRPNDSGPTHHGPPDSGPAHGTPSHGEPSTQAGSPAPHAGRTDIGSTHVGSTHGGSAHIASTRPAPHHPTTPLPASSRGPMGRGTVAAVDAVSVAWAERFARALAPLRTDAVQGERHARVSVPLPQMARLLDELGLARATPASLMARWADAGDDAETLGGRGWAVLGAGPRGPVCVDLATEGPHLLIEGPSGSGRTELLRSVAASLAAAERPDRLGIILIDGRDDTGGNAAGQGEGLRVCTDLPHVTTHLAANDPVRMREFAQSLSAELKRRAELLGRLDFAEWHTRREVSGRMVTQRSASGGGSSGAGDLDAPSSSTLRLRPSAAARECTEPGPPLARLVVVVDDLDALLFPALGSLGRPSAGSVVRALEAVAREGQRLGVHLVAAAGVEGRAADSELARSAALRVTLDAASAAAPGPDEPAPGRGQLLGPDGRVTPFQAGRVTGRIPRTATLRPTVVPLEWHRMGDPPARRPVRELGNGPTDLALLASALERAARSVSATEVPSLL